MREHLLGVGVSRRPDVAVLGIVGIEAPQDADALVAQAIVDIGAPAVAGDGECRAQHAGIARDDARHAVDKADRKDPLGVEAAVGGAHRDCAIVDRGQSQRAAIVAADCKRHVAGSDRDAGTARGAARALHRVVGVADAAAGAREAADAHGELVHVGLADDDGAGLPQTRDEGGVVGRLVADERERSDGRRHVVGVEIVLHRDWSAE